MSHHLGSIPALYSAFGQDLPYWYPMGSQAGSCGALPSLHVWALWDPMYRKLIQSLRTDSDISILNMLQVASVPHRKILLLPVSSECDRKRHDDQFIPIYLELFPHQVRDLTTASPDSPKSSFWQPMGRTWDERETSALVFNMASMKLPKASAIKLLKYESNGLD